MGQFGAMEGGDGRSRRSECCAASATRLRAQRRSSCCLHTYLLALLDLLADRHLLPLDRHLVAPALVALFPTVVRGVDAAVLLLPPHAPARGKRRSQSGGSTVGAAPPRQAHFQRPFRRPTSGGVRGGVLGLLLAWVPPISGPEASRIGEFRPRRRRRGTPLTAPCPTRTSRGPCDPRTSSP